MNREQVNTIMAKILVELNERLKELDELEDQLEGEAAERVSRQREIRAEETILQARRHHLEWRLRNNRFMQDPDESALSPERRARLEQALEAVSRTIAAAQSFDAAMRIAAGAAMAIGDATSAAR